MFEPALVAEAESLLAFLRARKLKLATAESCTGGLIAALLTEVPGSSDVVERGFVTYSNEAKAESIGVPPYLIERHGAVSAEVADAMAAGAIAHSHADIAVAVTGVAGPGGGTEKKPVGLVHLATRTRCGAHLASTLCLGDIGRSAIRMATVREALQLIRSIAENVDQAARP